METGLRFTPDRVRDEFCFWVCERLFFQALSQSFSRLVVAQFWVAGLSIYLEVTSPSLTAAGSVCGRFGMTVFDSLIVAGPGP